jgi:hypothetical protein
MLPKQQKNQQWWKFKNNPKMLKLVDTSPKTCHKVLRQTFWYMALQEC